MPAPLSSQRFGSTVRDTVLCFRKLKERSGGGLMFYCNYNALCRASSSFADRALIGSRRHWNFPVNFRSLNLSWDIFLITAQQVRNRVSRVLGAIPAKRNNPCEVNTLRVQTHLLIATRPVNCESQSSRTQIISLPPRAATAVRWRYSFAVPIPWIFQVRETDAKDANVTRHKLYGWNQCNSTPGWFRGTLVLCWRVCPTLAQIWMPVTRTFEEGLWLP